MAPSDEIQVKLVHIWSDLLGIPANQIGVNDDFFSLGGDSLMVQRLSFKISNLFSRNINVAAIFKNNNVWALSKYISNEGVSLTGIIPAISEKFPLSFAQERLLFIDEYENGTNAYNVAMYLEVNATTNRNILKKALISVILRHEILRSLPMKNAQTNCHVQRVLHAQDVESIFSMDEIAVEDFNKLDLELEKTSQHTFRISEEMPIKIHLFNVQNYDSGYFLSAVFHHMSFDGWSWAIFQRDVKAYYHLHYCQTHSMIADDLPSLKIQYKDFAVWQRENISGRELWKLLDFWKRKLQGYEQLIMPLDFPRPAQFVYTGQNVVFHLDEVTTSDLKTLAMKLKISLFSVLVSAYCLTLGYYSNQFDILIGTPVANRTHQELENLIGFFVNMLPLRIRIDPAVSVANYLETVSNEIIQAQIHQELPFEKLIKEMCVHKDTSRHPLVQVIFSLDPFETTLAPDTVIDDGPSRVSFTPYYPKHSNRRVAKYDLVTTVNHCDGQLAGHVNFCTKLFHESTIYSMANSFVHTLTQFSRLGKDTILSDLQCADIDQYADYRNDHKQSACARKMLHEIFEEEVEKSAEQIAIVDHDTTLTYQQLNNHANQLSRYLRSMKSIPPDSLIALFFDKSHLMVISVLSVWKSGAGYVSIDPCFPDERIRHILQATRAEIVVTNQVSASRLRKIIDDQISLVEIDLPDTVNLIRRQPMSNCVSDAMHKNLAYVIFTSGTTGRPKGVLIEHKSVVNMRNDLINRYFGQQHPAQEQQGVLLLSNYVFDFSVEQLMLSILASNKLIIVANDELFDDACYTYLNSAGLTYLSGTPTFIEQLDLSKLNHLQMVTVAGEQFTRCHFDKIRQGFRGVINNAYGITETTIYNTVHRFDIGAPFVNALGQLMSNMKQYVINDSLQLLPRGAIGELYLAGKCLSRGYLNQPELTAQRFLPNPFQTTDDKMNGEFPCIYKSGDLVRYKQDGQLEYLGRNDFQVKIRGLRIELAEIESAMSVYPAIVQCAVLAKKDGSAENKYLVGYFVAKDNAKIAEIEIKAYLETILPSYMIPKKFIQITHRLPVTITGKLDTKALPDVKISTSQNGYAAPRNAIERKMCAIWSELLALPNVGIDGDFFQIGGDSILSQQLAGLIRSKLNIRISVKDIFVCKTIRRLHDDIFEKCQTVNMEKIGLKTEQGILIGTCPMLPIQKWFFAKELSNPNYWNQSFAIRTPALDLGKLYQSLVKLSNHHDAFGLRYMKDGDSYIQYYTNDRKSIFTLKTHDIKNDQLIHHLINQWQSGFDLENGPLCSVVYIHGFDDGSARIWIAMHHLIVDAISWRIICQDLEILYNHDQLGQKGTSYRQWAQAIENYVQYMVTEKMYWQNLIIKVQPFNDRLVKMINEGSPKRKESFTLIKTHTDRLLRECNQIYSTQIKHLLLTALAYAIANLTGDPVGYVTLESHGREEIDQTLDMSRTVGWFTTMCPVELSVTTDLNATIQNIKRSVESNPNKGIGYGPYFGYNKSLPLVVFNYLGQFENVSGKDWSLTDINVDFECDRSMQSPEVDTDVISVDGFCATGRMQFNVVSRMDNRKTKQFAAIFKKKLEEIASSAMRSVNGRYPSEVLDDFDPCVEFHSEHKKILFLLPPGEGGAESYFNNIVKTLSSIRLVVFNNYYLHTGKSPTTFQELATIYIHFIKQAQPHGPYNFLGWSFGGVLALEISKQLSDVGDQIDNIIFIDSYFDVVKAAQAIRINDQFLVDRINYLYAQSRGCPDFDHLAASAKNVALFRAWKLNDMAKTDDEKRFFEYYMQTRYNNLDNLMDQTVIKLISMENDSHTSWVFNDRILVDMANYIMSWM